MLRRFLAAPILLGTSLAANAQIPVTDIILNTQTAASWMSQAASMAQQIAQMVQQYQVMQAQLDAIRGGRGMQGIAGMSYTQRNYLPDNYSALMNSNSSDYQAIAAANAILSTTTMANLSPQQRSIIEAGRRAAAVAQTSSQTAYQNTSARFQQLQNLIDSIGSATDAKAIADLQARIAGEQMMIAGEQNKLVALQQATAADQAALDQQRRERAMQGTGDIRTIPAVTY